MFRNAAWLLLPLMFACASTPRFEQSTELAANAFRFAAGDEAVSTAEAETAGALLISAAKWAADEGVEALIGIFR